jgi:hypothetical protein
MKIASWSGLAALCLCAAPLLASAADDAAKSNDAIVVNGARLSDLRKTMLKAQNRFLSLYNTVNRNVDQQLACSDSAPTGSRLTQRSCSTRAQNRATEEMARNFLSAVTSISANQAQGAVTREQASTKAQAGAPLSADESAALAGAGQTADTSIDPKAQEAASRVSNEALDFEENLKRLLETHPDLRERFEEYMAARQRYVEAGGRP